MLMKIIFINIAVFISLRIVSIIFTLFVFESKSAIQWIELPASLENLLSQPWSLITYMFAQYDILHILFNMLWLYWFGSIFMSYFTQKQLLGLYLLGGFGGAILYILAYNIFPYFAPAINDSYMLGASASVIAIVVATAMRAPDYKIGLLFLGAVSLKWIAIFTISIDILSVDSANAGGHIAHIGGALIGVLYAISFKKGVDITNWINKICDKIVLLFTRPSKYQFSNKNKNKYTYSAPKSNNENTMTSADMDAMNIILDKIKKSGYSSLSADEKKKLFDVSKKK
ncbi:MAG: rhomboid family intramembrane serine protease [Muribaculaceae bacterium]